MVGAGRKLGGVGGRGGGVRSRREGYGKKRYSEVRAQRICPLTGDRDRGISSCLQYYHDLALCVPYYLMELGVGPGEMTEYVILDDFLVFYPGYTRALPGVGRGFSIS